MQMFFVHRGRRLTRKTSFWRTDEAGGGRRCSRLAQARPENHELSFNVFEMQLFPLTHSNLMNPHGNKQRL